MHVRSVQVCADFNINLSITVPNYMPPMYVMCYTCRCVYLRIMPWTSMGCFVLSPQTWDQVFLQNKHLFQNHNTTITARHFPIECQTEFQCLAQLLDELSNPSWIVDTLTKNTGCMNWIEYDWIGALTLAWSGLVPLTCGHFALDSNTPSSTSRECETSSSRQNCINSLSHYTIQALQLLSESFDSSSPFKRLIHGLSWQDISP